LRQIAYIMKRFTPLFWLLLLLCSVAKAQMLEQVDMSTIGNLNNTYLTGINDKGFVSGYYTAGGSNYGFVITPEGTRLIVNPLALSATDTKVEGINDNNVALVAATVGGNTVQYKCYIDAVTDTITGFLPINNVQQTSAVPLDINNYNDVSGWYQAAQRWLYVQHDSIVPGGNTAWEAARYQTAGPVYYNTWGTGINDANDVAGYYLDGSLYYPFKYDNLSGAFTLLAYGGFKIKPTDINNQGWMTGEYQQGNGFWMGFYTYTGTGTITQWHSLDIIFDNTTIQSVANGINANQDVVGSFLHPDGHWVGFIYHPNVPEYRMPGNFTIHQNTWPMRNSSVGNNRIWNPGYWGGSNYMTQDPYANNGFPLVNQQLMTQYNFTTLADSMCPSWLGFAYEIDSLGLGLLTGTFNINLYDNITKPIFFSKLVQLPIKYSFGGYCYGFSYTTLLRYFDDPLFTDWFGLPANSNLPQINNNDNIAIRAIERTQHKQFSNPELVKYMPGFHDKISMWAGLYRLKNNYRLPINETNPRAVYHKRINMSGNDEWHSILPYKIKTPTKLPFNFPTMKYDTLFIYDSNHPMDSSQYYTIRSVEYNVPEDSVKNTQYSNLVYLSFNEVSIKEIMEVEHTSFKSTSGTNNSPYLAFSLSRSLYYTINGSGGSQATLNGSGFNTNTTDFVAMQNKSEGVQAPVGFSLDTNKTVTFTTYNYVDSVMLWNQNNSRRTMGISRDALPTEMDHSTLKNRFISYGNPDAVTKYFAAYLNEASDDMTMGTSITASNICIAQGDSILIENPTPYVFKITKVNGTASCTYFLDVYTAYNGDTVKEHHTEIELTGNTSHTIDPYYNGNEISVSVDNGLDGSIDNTILITGWPVGTKNIIQKNGIKVYPNPVQDELNVEFAIAGKYNITITDIVGRVLDSKHVLMSTGKETLPMGQLPAGIYLIQIADEKGNVILKDKIIKQ
jgi:hypothetical protein